MGPELPREQLQQRILPMATCTREDGVSRYDNELTR
jgi:hypothetical protein